VSEHSPDGLFGGSDGTESPALLPDPSGRDGWRDAPELPPFTLPPLPNTRLMRDAIAAALGEDPTGLLDQGAGAAPAPPPAWPNAAQPAVAQPNAALANHLTAPLPRPVPQVEAPRPAGAPGRSPRPIFPAPGPSAAPRRRGPGGLRSRYRPPLAAGPRTPVRLGDLPRRISRQRPALPLAHSNGGAGLFFVISAILFVALAYGVVTGIVEAIARLLP
jgi:hypothetical protein